MIMKPAIDNKWSQLKQLPPQWVAAVVGAAFSLWSIVKNPVLNDDAYQYLRAAELFSSDGASAVFTHYGWFNYSIVIALLHRVLPGSLLASAHVLNLLLQTLLITTFVRVSQRVQAGRRIGWLAALALLAYPQLNEMRFMLIRDFGFLAFVLLSLELLLLLRDSGRWQHAALWVFAISLAAVFRLEALMLAVVAPLALLGNGNHRKVLWLYFILFALALFTSFVSALMQVDLPGLIQFAYRYYLPPLFDLPALMAHSGNLVMQQLFSPDNFPASNNAAVGPIILLFAYGYSVLAILVQALSVPLSLLLLHAGWRGWLRPAEAMRGPLAAYAFCAFLSLLLFISIMHFLTERYTMLLCLLLLLLVPGVLNRWIDHAQTKRKRSRYVFAAGFFLVYFFTDSLVSFGYSTDYLPQALGWLRANDTASTAFHTNSPYMAYGSGRISDYDNIHQNIIETLANIQSGDTLALTVGGEDQTTKNMLQQDQRLVLLQIFANRKNDAVRIYRVQ
jgi:hypothetical protein